MKLLNTRLLLLTAMVGLMDGQIAHGQNGGTFFQEDFASGLPSGWSVTDNSFNGINWKYSTTGAANASSQPFPSLLSVAGTTAGNGFLLYDSDSSGQSVGGEDADLTSIRIDCSAHSNIRLSFNQLLVHLNELARVYVSNDSTSWVEVARLSDSLLPYTASPNPESVLVDISAYADQQPAVWLRFNFFGDYDFWWMIDDIRLFELIPYVDLAAVSVSSPADACTGLSNSEYVTTQIRNEGTAAAWGYVTGYVLDGQPPVLEMIPDTLQPGSSISHTFQASADLSLPQVHHITCFISHPYDTLPGNDSAIASVLSGPLSVADAATSFENRDERTGWSSLNVNQDATTWEVAANLPADPVALLGDSCMVLESPSALNFTNDWLVSPCVLLSDTVSYTVDYWIRTASDLSDGFLQLALVSDPSSVAGAIPIGSSFYCSDTVYTHVTSSLFTPPNTGIFHIGFQGLIGFGPVSMRIDGFRINTAYTSEVSELANNKTAVRPNPFSDFLVVSAPTKEDMIVRMYSAEGRLLVQQRCLVGSDILLYTSNLDAGVYFVEWSVDNRLHRKKVLKTGK